MMDKAEIAHDHGGEAATMNFSTILMVAMAAVATGALAYIFGAALGPDPNARAETHIAVELGSVKQGETDVVTWKDNPVIIRHLTKQQMSQLQAIPTRSLQQPVSLATRITPGLPNVIVVVAVDPASGCEVVATPDGFDDPCNGARYDAAGRALNAAAARNLTIPPYRFADRNTIVLG